jgi:DNA-binding transcriptional LysR family regulator
LGRRIELTEAGQAFLADTRAVLELVERAKTSAQRIARGEKGSLRIGFTGSACCHPLVPAAINGLRASHPDVELILSERRTSPNACAKDVSISRSLARILRICRIWFIT